MSAKSTKSKTPFGVWLKDQPIIILITVLAAIVTIIGSVPMPAIQAYLKGCVSKHISLAADSSYQPVYLDANNSRVTTSVVNNVLAANGNVIVSNGGANNNGGGSNSENNNGGGSNSGGNNNGTVSNDGVN